MKPIVGGTPNASLAAIPTLPGTSRWLNVIVPIFPDGMSCALGAFVALAFGAANTFAGPMGDNAAAAVAPAPARSWRRLIVLSKASCRLSAWWLQLI
jgi:hypothetical protein